MENGPCWKALEVGEHLFATDQSSDVGVGRLILFIDTLVLAIAPSVQWIFAFARTPCGFGCCLWSAKGEQQISYLPGSAGHP